MSEGKEEEWEVFAWGCKEFLQVAVTGKVKQIGLQAGREIKISTTNGGLKEE